MSINQELKKIISEIKYNFEINQAEIADKLEVTPTYLSDMINGRVPFSDSIKIKIYEVFKIDIRENKNNLLIDELNYDLIDTEEKYKKAIAAGLKMLPEVDFIFSAGQKALTANTDTTVRFWHLPDCEDCEAIARMAGNSMMPTLPPGCQLALKRYGYDITRPNTIAFGNMYGIVIEDPSTGLWHGHIKVLRRHRDPELAKKYWIAHSINTAEYDDFDIDLTLVRGLWVVKQHVVTNVLL